MWTISAVTRRNARDHLVITLALGTGLRLGEIVGLNVGDVYIRPPTPTRLQRLTSRVSDDGRFRLRRLGFTSCYLVL